MQKNRSRITSGRSLLPHGVEMGGVWERRWSDLIRLFVDELGGDNVVSQAQRSLVRRIATIQVQLERYEQTFAEQETGGSVRQLDSYVKLSNTLRRILVTVGIKRVPRDIPDLKDYIAGHATKSRRERVRLDRDGEDD
jgi:hypothetical protein